MNRIGDGTSARAFERAAADRSCSALVFDRDPRSRTPRHVPRPGALGTCRGPLDEFARSGRPGSTLHHLVRDALRHQRRGLRCREGQVGCLPVRDGGRLAA
jgi:hypothetical protein